jgi:hypothetical protein
MTSTEDRKRYASMLHYGALLRMEFDGMESSRGIRVAGVFLLVVFALLVLQLPVAQAQAGAVTVQVKTDRASYSVGDPVTVAVFIGVPYEPPSYLADVTLFFTTPAGSVMRVVGSQGYGIWQSYTITGLTVSAGDYAVAANVQMQDNAYSSPPAYFTVTGAPFDFSIDLSPHYQKVKQGESATFAILVTFSDPSWNGIEIDIELSGLHPTMSSSLVGMQLRISTSGSTPIQAYTLTLIGSARGVTRQTSATLDVVASAPSFDFSVSISPAVQTIKIGEKASYSVTVNLIAGSAQIVSLASSGFPTALTCSFSPLSGTPTFSSILTVDASQASSVGTYTITVTATGGGKTHTTSATLTVEKKSKQQTSLTIQAISQDGTIIVSGKLTPPVAGVEVIISYRSPNGMVITHKNPVDLNGNFGDSYAPDITGTWTISASWSGNDQYDGSESQSANVTIHRTMTSTTTWATTATSSATTTSTATVTVTTESDFDKMIESLIERIIHWLQCLFGEC